MAFYLSKEIATVVVIRAAWQMCRGLEELDLRNTSSSGFVPAFICIHSKSMHIQRAGKKQQQQMDQKSTKITQHGIFFRRPFTSQLMRNHHVFTRTNKRTEHVAVHSPWHLIRLCGFFCFMEGYTVSQFHLLNGLNGLLQ